MLGAAPPSPGLSKLDEPRGDVPRHDDQRVLELAVCFGGQFTVNELTSGDDLLTHSILQQHTQNRPAINIKQHIDRKTVTDDCFYLCLI